MRAGAERDQPQPVARHRTGGSSTSSAPTASSARATPDRRPTCRSRGAPTAGTTPRSRRARCPRRGRACACSRPARPDASISQSAPIVSRTPSLLDLDAMARAVDVDALARSCRVVEACAAAHGLVDEEVLEHAAVDLPRRRRHEAARAELGHVLQFALAFREEEAEAELAQVPRVEMRAQPERVGEVVRADLDARLADLVGGRRRRRRRVARRRARRATACASSAAARA